jgi:hypothetical protein
MQRALLRRFMTAVCKAPRRSLMVGVAAVLAFGTGASVVAAGSGALPPIQLIRFARGASSAAVGSAVVRGDRDLYAFKARAGQLLMLCISAVENNAAFEVYAPGAQPRLVDDIVEITGAALPGAGAGNDAMRWTGRLPVSGAYLVVVGGTRGNATYRLAVTLH